MASNALGRRRPPIVIGLTAVGLIVLLAVLAWVAQQAWRPLATPTSQSQGPSPLTGAVSLEDVQARPHLVFQNVIRGADYAEVSLVALDAPEARRFATGLVCERVHFAGGQGICLAAEHGAESTYFARVFGRDFAPRVSIPLAGSPNLARVSPDGRYGAVTVITVQRTEEDEPANLTVLIDMAGGTVIADLAEFALTRDGADVQDANLDIWGVSFASADSDRFYATVRTSGNNHLVEGSVADRAMRVLHENVSAPAVSPDGTRIAYAKLMTNIGPTWRFHVLDLATMAETPLGEMSSIDDQPEWLDDAHILYGLSGDLFVAQADGGGDPRVFLEDGLSPAVVR